MSHSACASDLAGIRARRSASPRDVPADPATHLSRHAEADGARITGPKLPPSEGYGARKGQSRPGLTLAALQGLAALLRRGRCAGKLDPDRLSDHMRRDLGLTSHVEQGRWAG